MSRIDHPILGAWRLRRWEILSPGKTPQLPYGEDADGRLLYTADGHMLAAICRHGRAPLSAPSARGASEAERLQAFDSFFCYGGRYEIRDDHVVHHVEIALFPNFVGTEQLRLMRFDGDGLLLSAAEDGAGGLRHHRLHWRRF